MYVVWNEENEMYVGRKERGWPHRRVFTMDIRKAQVYRNKGAIKNSIGLNSSNVPGRNTKTLPDWARICKIYPRIEEESTE
jgi:hypothetical protein